MSTLVSETGFAAFRHKEFVAYLMARFAAMMAMQMQVVAIGWEVYDRGNSAFDLALIGLVQFAPVLPLFLVAGQVIDRSDRRTVLLSCYAVHICCGASLLTMMLADTLNFPLVLAILFAIGGTRVFEHPAGASLLPNLMPPEAIKSAVSWNSASSQTAVVLGPAIGGFVYFLGPWTVFACSLTMQMIAFAAMRRVRKRPAPDAVVQRDWRSLLLGIGFMGSRREILGAISLDLFAVLVGSAVALLPIFARDVLVVGPWGLGLLRSATAVGSIMTGAWLAFHPIERNAGLKMLGGVAVFGLSLLVFGASTSFPLSLLALFMLGAGDQVSVNVRQTLIQFRTPDEVRGRVNSVNAMFINTSNQLGQFEAGAMAAIFGAVNATIIGGVGVLIVVGVCAVVCVSLRRVDAMELPRMP